jgi:oxidase EvaA
VRLRARQSEDGGRFFHDDTTHVVVELPEDQPLDVPPNYRWMSLGLLRRVMRRGYTVAIEARSLLACLG